MIDVGLEVGLAAVRYVGVAIVVAIVTRDRAAVLLVARRRAVVVAALVATHEAVVDVGEVGLALVRLEAVAVGGARLATHGRADTAGAIVRRAGQLAFAAVFRVVRGRCLAAVRRITVALRRARCARPFAAHAVPARATRVARLAAGAAARHVGLGVLAAAAAAEPGVRTIRVRRTARRAHRAHALGPGRTIGVDRAVDAQAASRVARDAATVGVAHATELAVAARRTERPFAATAQIGLARGVTLDAVTSRRITHARGFEGGAVVVTRAGRRRGRRWRGLNRAVAALAQACVRRRGHVGNEVIVGRRTTEDGNRGQEGKKPRPEGSGEPASPANPFDGTTRRVARTISEIFELQALQCISLASPFSEQSATRRFSKARSHTNSA